MCPRSECVSAPLQSPRSVRGATHEDPATRHDTDTTLPLRRRGARACSSSPCPRSGLRSPALRSRSAVRSLRCEATPPWRDERHRASRLAPSQKGQMAQTNQRYALPAAIPRTRPPATQHTPSGVAHRPERHPYSSTHTRPRTYSHTLADAHDMVAHAALRARLRAPQGKRVRQQHSKATDRTITSKSESSTTAHIAGIAPRKENSVSEDRGRRVQGDLTSSLSQSCSPATPGARTPIRGTVHA